MRPTSSCPPHRDGDPCGYAHWCGCADRARQAATVTQATEAADVHEALDIGRDLATEVAFHLVVLLEFLTDLVHFVGGKIINVALPVHTGGAQDLQGRSTADAIDIGERNVHTFATRQINTCNSRHSTSPALALALLVPGVFADNSKNTLAPDHLALGAYFFDGRSDFHDSSPMSGQSHPALRDQGLPLPEAQHKPGQYGCSPLISSGNRNLYPSLPALSTTNCRPVQAAVRNAQDPGPVRRNGYTVFKMRSQAAVACHSSPFVFQNVHLVAAGGDHGLNGDDHAVTQGQPRPPG